RRNRIRTLRVRISRAAYTRVLIHRDNRSGGNRASACVLNQTGEVAAIAGGGRGQRDEQQHNGAGHCRLKPSNAAWSLAIPAAIWALRAADASVAPLVARSSRSTSAGKPSAIVCHVPDATAEADRLGRIGASRRRISPIESESAAACSRAIRLSSASSAADNCVSTSGGNRRARERNANAR